MPPSDRENTSTQGWHSGTALRKSNERIGEKEASLSPSQMDPKENVQWVCPCDFFWVLTLYQGSTALELARSISPSLAKASVVASVNGVLQDLSRPLLQDSR
jgi:hypothetical protein